MCLVVRGEEQRTLSYSFTPTSNFSSSDKVQLDRSFTQKQFGCRERAIDKLHPVSHSSIGKSFVLSFPIQLFTAFFKREQAQITFLRTVSVRLRSLAKKLLIHLLLFFKFDKKLPFIHYKKSKQESMGHKLSDKTIAHSLQRSAICRRSPIEIKQSSRFLG